MEIKEDCNSPAARLNNALSMFSEHKAAQPFQYLVSIQLRDMVYMNNRMGLPFTVELIDAEGHHGNSHVLQINGFPIEGEAINHIDPNTGPAAIAFDLNDPSSAADIYTFLAYPYAQTLRHFKIYEQVTKNTIKDAD